MLLPTSKTFTRADVSLAGGSQLAELTLAYETFGTLADDGNNAILLCHGYTSHPHAGGDADGWFATGDIGLVDKDRNLIIRGRASNVINVGGSKASPELLEEDIRAFSQVRDVGVSGVDLPVGFHEICAAIVSNSKLSVDDVNRHLKRRKAQWPVDRVKIVPAIPKTETGKIDRVALKRLCSEQN